MSDKFTGQIYSRIPNALRKKDCLKAESSYYAVELLHLKLQQKDIFLDWLWALLWLEGLFVNTGNVRAIDNQSNCFGQSHIVLLWGEKITLRCSLTQYKCKCAVGLMIHTLCWQPLYRNATKSWSIKLKHLILVFCDIVQPRK